MFKVSSVSDSYPLIICAFFLSSSFPDDVLLYTLGIAKKKGDVAVSSAPIL